MHTARIVAASLLAVLWTGLVGFFLAAPAHPAFLTKEILADMSSAIGVSAGVAPNAYNTLDAQLEAKQQALDAREAALQKQEEASAAQSEISAQNSNSRMYVFYLLGGAFIVLLLLINIYFDIRVSMRERRLESRVERFIPAGPPAAS